MTKVSLIDLTKKYPQTKHPAVEHLSLEIEPGKIVALLGPSGCGKTSTLKMAAGLLSPDSGDVLFDGLSVLNVPAERRDAVMVFQEHSLFPFMSVGENIGFGLKVRHLDKQAILSRVEQMLELVQLPGLSEKKPAELSGGQRQRVALARALIIEPKLLLLDEPLANLDAHLRDEMRSLILDVQKKTAITTLVVTHDQEEAVLLADHIALMFDGSLVHYAPPEELFQRPRNERAARFFGARNFIPAVKKGLQAVTPAGSFVLDPVKVGTVPDGEFLLTIRPEHIRLEEKEGCNTFSVKLASAIFAGTHTRYKILMNGLELEALKDVDSFPLKPWGRLNITFPPEHIWLLPR
jgi:ABC-type Fe3+/spermidine/putrescine transport system ATPase subunit